MKITKKIVILWKRYRRVERLRKQMNLTWKCARETDVFLRMLGIDFSNFEYVKPDWEELDKLEQ